MVFSVVSVCFLPGPFNHIAEERWWMERNGMTSFQQLYVRISNYVCPRDPPFTFRLSCEVETLLKDLPIDDVSFKCRRKRREKSVICG